MHFELFVVADELDYYLVNCIVELEEFVFLVVLVRKDVLFQVHLHEVKQLKEKLTYPQVFANHLSLNHREDMLRLSLLLTTFLNEDLNLSYLHSHLHHPQITDLLGSLNRTPLQILSQLYVH